MGTFRFRRTDPHTLAGAYALDALGGADRARFERHLSACPSCSQETRGLQETTSRLAASAATRPPDGLRDRVLAAAAAPGRTRPRVGRCAGSPPAWPGRRWGDGDRVRACWLSPWRSAASRSTPQHQLNQEQARSPGDRRGAERAGRDHDDGRRPATRGTATVVMSHRDRALVFTAARLPGLPSSERYELWLMGQRGPRAGGHAAASRTPG